MRLGDFLRSEEAVIGLPLRLVVCVVIGMISLGSILGFMTSRDLFPDSLVVSVVPMLTMVGNGTQNVSFLVTVQNPQGGGVESATVIVSGLGGAGMGRTNGSGKALVSLAVVLEPGLFEGYLGVRVDAVSHARYLSGSMLKVVRESEAG